jgi:outer membrane protein OmpA-like peptidoglycan-associated protein
MQDQLTSWNSGSVTINALTGKNYQLVVQRDGYSDRVIAIGVIDETPTEDLNIALVPDEVKKLQQTDIDLSNASMLVMSGPTGNDQLYISTDDELYQYTIENDNHYLIKDGEKIMLKERTRSLDSKVKTKQDSDQFSLRSEDQFLYDQLSGDEKAMVDRISNTLGEGKQLTDDPELAIYYNNLPPEYRSMIDRMAKNESQAVTPEVAHNDLNTSEYLKQVLAENNVSVSGVFNVNNIYYDFDKSTIREDAAAELDKLLAIMLNNKHIKVSMFSHTDSRGSNSYNDKLSEKRGISAVNYLVERGISIDRFTTQAKGESQLVNSCGDQMTCDEDAHQLNRRTEFILTA